MSVSGLSVLAFLHGVLFCVAFTQATQHDNRHAFEVLCSLYTLADAPVKIPDVALTEHIPMDLIKLNMTTADDTWYTLFDANDPGTWDEARKLDKFKAFENDAEWSEMYPKWYAAKKGLLHDTKDKNEFLRPTASHQRKSAHFQIRRLWRRFLEEEKERNSLADTLEKLESEIKKKFNASRTGNEHEKTKVTAASFDKGGAEDRTSNNICGGNTGGTETGTSLANDLACICTGSGSISTGSDTICDAKYSPGAAKSWGSGATDIIEAVPLIVTHCPPNPKDFQVTPDAIRDRIARFWSALGMHAGSSGGAGSSYVLGGATVSGAGDCSGDAATNANDVCVNYKTNLKGTALAEPNGIPWLNQLEAAITEMDKLAEEEKKIHALTARAESLRDAAWAAYEQALLADPTENAPETNTTASKTTRPATSVPGASRKNEEPSAVTTPRFIIPWTLLL